VSGGVGRAAPAGIAVELIEHDRDAAGPLAELVHRLYVEQYPPGPDLAEWREGLRARHRARSGFRLVLAREHDRVAGLTWGYVGAPGQYRSDEVARRLPPAAADARPDDHGEVPARARLPRIAVQPPLAVGRRITHATVWRQVVLSSRSRRHSRQVSQMMTASSTVSTATATDGCTTSS